MTQPVASRPDLIERDPKTLTDVERRGRLLALARIVLERSGLDPDKAETWPPLHKMKRRIEDIPQHLRPRVH